MWYIIIGYISCGFLAMIMGLRDCKRRRSRLDMNDLLASFFILGIWGPFGFAAIALITVGCAVVRNANKISCDKFVAWLNRVV